MKTLTRKTLLVVSSALGLTASAGMSHAGLISFTGAGGIADGSGMTQSIDIGTADLGGLVDNIFDVNLEVQFSKCGKSVDAVNGCLGGHSSSYTYNKEISFALTRDKTSVVLVAPYTFSGQVGNVNAVTQNYDDEAARQVGGSFINSGVFKPVQSLSAFDGQSAVGSWDFWFADSVNLDPLLVHGWTLTLDLRESVSTVPEPSSLALLGMGALGFGASVHRNRLAKKNSSETPIS